jgi:hypothetical protein
LLSRLPEESDACPAKQLLPIFEKGTKPPKPETTESHAIWLGIQPVAFFATDI